MKVKIVKSDNLHTLEENINELLKYKNNDDVIDIKFNNPTKADGKSLLYSAMIIYK